jgi:hypothetical protein
MKQVRVFLPQNRIVNGSTESHLTSTPLKFYSVGNFTFAVHAIVASGFM